MPKEGASLTGRGSRKTLDDGFYRAFEDRFRGSQELIRSRLEIYLPFILPLKQIEKRPAALDLGCGRGEWLALLSENGFNVQGVDLDERMLSACKEQGLDAIRGDASSFLEQLPDESKSIISGFHIAEHLSFQQLQTLVYEAFRVLKPHGLLILETPNPENIQVSTLTFYLDPTHRHPLPPALLTFLLDYYGFPRTKILRLQEDRDLLSSPTPSIEHVLYGASPDYAIIARKSTDEFSEQLFGECFDVELGVRMSELVKTYDTHQISHNTQMLRLADALVEERDARLVLEARLDELEARIKEEIKINADLIKKLSSLYCSTSWRVTAPLRFIGRRIQRLWGGLV
ncbi:bifunctional 2-polyprenyl-6-hydroxyphenol methylase/3-demethylubiquinol 3-O-methyltransferase UbiG [Chelativorans sp. J32]|uniref:class I SAM-dependent methyltransferase n=1 Tax=Chelativorans sp. J32 TaxID=935840 RepID=UPI0004AEFD2E|nr:class I SAM-dependent methyltransferase [Chelativorans sp. J32]